MEEGKRDGKRRVEGKRRVWWVKVEGERELKKVVREGI